MTWAAPKRWPMFPIAAVGIVGCFALGDLAVGRWKARRAAELAATSTAYQ